MDHSAARAARVQAVAALDEPTRRRLYDFVVGRRDPVGRDEAAAALGLPRSTAAFHLDRLVDEGLLAVEHERRSGRAGPGAGRPAKLYRRSDTEIEVSLPERHYQLAGRLLAGAVEDSGSGDCSAREALDRRARAYGRSAGRAGGSLTEMLVNHGYEPRPDDEGVDLVNCPFRALVAEYTALVCHMNLALLEGLLEGAEEPVLRARLRPKQGCCCVRLEPADMPYAQQGGKG